MVVEDDVLLALDLVDSLQDAGLEVTGPFSSVEAALQGMTRDRPHLAILDIDLNGQMSFPAADAFASVPAASSFATSTLLKIPIPWGAQQSRRLV